MSMPDDFNPNLPEPPEETDEPNYDDELDFESLVESIEPAGASIRIWDAVRAQHRRT